MRRVQIQIQPGPGSRYRYICRRSSQLGKGKGKAETEKLKNWRSCSSGGGACAHKSFFFGYATATERSAEFMYSFLTSPLLSRGAREPGLNLSPIPSPNSTPSTVNWVHLNCEIKVEIGNRKHKERTRGQRPIYRHCFHVSASFWLNSNRAGHRQKNASQLGSSALPQLQPRNVKVILGLGEWRGSATVSTGPTPVWASIPPFRPLLLCRTSGRSCVKCSSNERFSGPSPPAHNATFKQTGGHKTIRKQRQL